MKQMIVSVRVLLIIVVLTNPFSWAKDNKTNPDEIGNRDVGKGVNFYSLEKEIAMGKQMAQEVERQAKIIDALTVFIEEQRRCLAEGRARHDCS